LIVGKQLYFRSM